MFTRGRALAFAEPRPAQLPVSVVLPVGSGAVVGRTSSGSDWVTPLAGCHYLIAGCPGSGKSSAVWSLLAGVAPCVRYGLAQLWGVDLSGRVRLSRGKRLFHTLAHDQVAAVEVLEQLGSVLRSR